MPETEIQALHPSDKLPGGLVACHDGRGAMETPLGCGSGRHGEPVHGRDDFAAALEREPWSSWHGA